MVTSGGGKEKGRGKTAAELNSDEVAAELQRERERRINALAVQHHQACRTLEEKALAKVGRQVDAFIEDSARPYSDTEADLLRRLVRLRLQVMMSRTGRVEDELIVNRVRDELDEAVREHLPGF